MPLGIAPEEEHFFAKGLTRKVSIPQLREIDNAFVSHYGLVLQRGILQRGCAFNIRGTEDVSFHYAFWRQTIEEYAVCRWGKSLRSLHLKGPQRYLLIHSKWFNYAFWVNAYLPRLVQAEAVGVLKDHILIVPERWQDIPYVWDSLTAFDVHKEVVPDGVHLFVDRLTMPETRQYTATFHPPLVQATRARLASLVVGADVSLTRPHKRIYLSRGKRGLRCVENEDEVMAALAPLGFEKVLFEDLSIWQQIALMQQTQCFVSLHGAGLSNLMFMRPETSVLELVNVAYARKEYSFPFWRLADAAQLRYAAQFCPITGNEENLRLEYGNDSNASETDYLVNQNVVVDIPRLLQNIHILIST